VLGAGAGGWLAYLADVLLRVAEHPAARIDALLPQNWVPPVAVAPA